MRFHNHVGRMRIFVCAVLESIDTLHKKGVFFHPYYDASILYKAVIFPSLPYSLQWG